MGRMLVLALLSLVQAAAPPDTGIFLAPLSPGAPAVVGAPVNISRSAGYDNQPSFTPGRHDVDAAGDAANRPGGSSPIWARSGCTA
jgi:hypothetical protein